MVPFLSKFLRNFPAIQTKQILNLLSEARDKGELVSSKDLKEHLDQLAEVVSEEELKIRAPFLFFRDGDVLESDAVKTFIKTIQLDTEACLGEVENISNAIRAHHKLIVDNYFNEVEASMTELERRVSAYELLSKHKGRGFNRVFSYSFDGGISVPGASTSSISLQGETGDSVVKGITEAGSYNDTSPDNVIRTASEKGIRSVDRSVFVDVRGEQNLYWAPSHYGDLGLALASEDKYHKFVEASLVLDSSTTGSTTRNEEKNSVSGNHIYNILDGDPDTYWSYSVKVSELVDTCQIKLLLLFPEIKRINALDINPVSDYQMTLTDVAYIGTGGAEVTIPSFNAQYPNGVELPANSKAIVDIGDISARGVYLTFKQPKADRVQGTYLVDPTGDFRNLTPQQVIELPSNIDFPDLPQPDVSYLNYMHYSFGFKDILALERVYKPNGLFVTEKKKTGALRALAVDTDALFPSTELTDIEISIKKENYLKDSNKVLDTELFPVLPMGTERVNERLFLTERINSSTTDDTGKLRFYPDFSSDFKVYKNKTLLTLGTHYVISIDDGNTWEDSLAFTATRSSFAKCKVRISSPNTKAIFTISYKPLVSTQETNGQVFLNEQKTVELERNQTYLFSTARTEGEIYETYLSVQIICRSNTLNQRVTPYLKGIRMLYEVGALDG